MNDLLKEFLSERHPDYISPIMSGDQERYDEVKYEYHDWLIEQIKGLEHGKKEDNADGMVTFV